MLKIWANELSCYVKPENDAELLSSKKLKISEFNHAFKCTKTEHVIALL